MTTNDISGWFAGRLPDHWFDAAPEVNVDRDEIIVIGRLPAPEAKSTDDADGGETSTEAEAGRIARWRDDTRGGVRAV